MEPKFTPLSGAEGWQISNPPILSLAPLKASLALFEQAGMKRLRRKSLGLTRYLEWLLDRELGGRARLLTPADPERRGCHVALQFVPAPADPSGDEYLHPLLRQLREIHQLHDQTGKAIAALEAEVAKLIKTDQG